MKFLTLLLVLAATQVQAKAAFEGKFSMPHSIMDAYPTAHGCRSSGGTWDRDAAKEGSPACILETDDSVEIKKTKDGIAVDVSVVGRNAHECDFGGIGKFISKNVIRIVQPKNEDVAECTVEVTYSSKNVVSVSYESEGNCYCPSGTSLQIQSAKRVRK